MGLAVSGLGVVGEIDQKMLQRKVILYFKQG